MAGDREIFDRNGIRATISYGPSGEVLVNRSLSAYGVGSGSAAGELFPLTFNDEKRDETLAEDEHLRKVYSKRK